MQPPKSDATKRAVIEEYLRGKSRDQIAIDLHVGTGTVSKIVSEWKTGLDYPIADELRELALGLLKLGISASRYAEGARIASYLIKVGVNDEQFHHFVSEIYNRCKEMDLQPDKIASLLKQLLDLSGSIPLSQIPDNIEQQISWKQKLEQEIADLEQKIRDAKTRLDLALNEEETTRGDLNQFSGLKSVMQKNGVTMHDNSNFVGAVVGARQLGFDPRVIAEKVSNVQKLEIDKAALDLRVEFLNNERQKLEQTCDNLKREALVHSYRIDLYQDLESMGMGIKELKLLWNTVREIAAANNISEAEASARFYSDVVKQYDDKLGFEGEIQNLISEIQNKELSRFQISGTIALLNSIILNQLDQIQAVSGFVEFGSLVKAAKGQTVPQDQLKNAVIKAIDILMRSDPTDRSNNALNTTRLLLLEDIQKSGDIA